MKNAYYTYNAEAAHKTEQNLLAAICWGCVLFAAIAVYALLSM